MLSWKALSEYIDIELVIRIYRKCYGAMEKFITMIAVWHPKACQVMTTDDWVGWIFLSNPHTKN